MRGYTRINPEEVKAKLTEYIEEWTIGIEINKIMCDVLKSFDGKTISKRIITALSKKLEESNVDLWYIKYDNDSLMGQYFSIVIRGKGNRESKEYGRFYLNREKTDKFNYQSFASDNYLNQMKKWIDEANHKMAMIDEEAKLWNKKVDELNNILLPMMQKYPTDLYTN